MTETGTGTETEDDADLDAPASTAEESATGTRADETEHQRTTVRISDSDTTVIARTVTRVVTPLILLIAFMLLIRGHNLPGGGFIAGVLTAAAVALVYIIYGLEHLDEELLDRIEGENTPAVEAEGESEAENEGEIETLSALVPRIVEDYATLFAGGLAVAAGSGVAAMVLGAPFLTQAVVFLEEVPIYHEIELASALVFDLGVYFVVVGSVLTVLAVVGAE